MQAELNAERFMDQASERELRDAIAHAYRKLGRKRLNTGSTGNVSCRMGNTILITPTGGRWESLTAESVVRMNLEGVLLGPGTPSCEWEMHIEVYRRKPTAKAIVHTHSDACVALSSLRRPIPAFHYMVVGFGGDDVPCAPYAPFGSHELACAAGDALSERTACLLANHGMVCHGETLLEAVLAAFTLEALSRQYLMALCAGQPTILTSAEISAIRTRLHSYGHATSLSF